MILVFIGIFICSLPYLFKLPSVHEKAETFIARQVKGDFSFQKGSLALFPRPCIRIHNAELKTERGVSATIDMVSAYPSLRSLFLGKVNVTRITAVRPNFIAEIPKTKAPAPLPATLKNLQDRLKAHTHMLAPVAYGKFTIEIQQGAFTLIQAKKRLFSIQKIDSRLEWTLPVISINISGSSGIWDEGNLTFSLNTANRKGEGQISLKMVAPKAVTDIVFPKNFPQVDNAVLDMNIALRTSSFDTLDLSFEVLNPDISLRNGKKVQMIQGQKAAGKLKIDENSAHVSITALDLSTPRLQLTGSFDLDIEKPSASWQVNARDVDIASTKAATLFFGAWSKIARRICSVLIEGSIPQISLGQEAPTLGGFRDVSTFHLYGRLNRGTVHVPKADLLLTETSGDVTISKGILEASYVKTRLGNSSGNQGRFTLYLKEKNPMPFYVETDIHADIEALPPLLAGRVKNRLFSDEMRRITSAEGTAAGKMILDRRSGPFRVTVDVSNFDISAIYERIPFPLSVTGNNFHFKNGAVLIRDTQGKIGNSHFADLSGEVSWHAAPFLTISTARADADVDEIVSWLDAEPTTAWITKNLHPKNGRIAIDSLRLEGPAKTPGDWQFQSEGHVTDTFSLLSPLFPKALLFHQGRFTMTRDKIDFSSEDLSVLGARVSAAGTLYDYMTKNRRLDAQIDGQLSGGACQWIHTKAKIPEMCRWQAPITLSPLTIHWLENDTIDVSGQATTQNGPFVSFDISKTPDMLVIKNLTIRDEDTQADVTLSLDKSVLEIGFSGSVKGSSLNALLLENNLLAGSIQGNFRARYLFDNPLKSTLIGDLQVFGLDANAFEVPLIITEASLSADRTSVEISTSHFTWKESGFFTSGRISQIEKGLQLDLDLDSKHLNWSEIKALRGDTQTNELHRPAFLFGRVRATCGNFILGPSMTFQPLEVEFQLNGDRTDIIFHQADACGISFPGTITLAPEKTLFSFKPFATEQSLEPTLACLQKGKKFMDGLFDLSGNLEFQLNGASIAESLNGEASLTAKNGRIYRAVLLGKIFSLLNIGGILSGEFPDLEKEGFPYKKSVFKGRFGHGRFELETGVIDSSGMKIFYEGKEDLVNRQHDLTVVVAPLRTVDSVVEKIPLVNSVLDKGALIYPIKVTGSWDKPELSLLSPTAVGGEVWGIMVRTLRLPVTLLESIFNGLKKEK